MPSVNEFLDGIGYIPPVPRNLNRLVSLLNRDDVNLEEIVELVQYDPALTAQVMRLCNSAYFGGATPASDLSEATARLGLNEVYQLVMALSTAGLMKPPQKGYGIEAGELWKHSVTSAVLGKLLALERDGPASTVFTACILHDLGKVVMSSGMDKKYAEVMAETKRSVSPMIVVERNLLGFDHAEVGAGLLERWKFPAELVEAVRFHHDPGLATEHRRLAAYVYLANAISCFMGYGCGHEALAMRGRSQALELLEMDPEDIPRCMTKAFYILRDTQALLEFGL